MGLLAWSLAEMRNVKADHALLAIKKQDVYVVYYKHTHCVLQTSERCSLPVGVVIDRRHKDRVIHTASVLGQYATMDLQTCSSSLINLYQTSCKKYVLNSSLQQ